MSWRRFRALLEGVGPNTALVAVASNRSSGNKTGPGKSEQVIEFDMHDPAQEEAFLTMILGPAKKKRKRKPKLNA